MLLSHKLLTLKFIVEHLLMLGNKKSQRNHYILTSKALMQLTFTKLTFECKRNVQIFFKVSYDKCREPISISYICR